MQQPILPYSHDRINDYRLILDTPRMLKKKIAAVKIIFDLEYKGTVIAGSDPFIYLSAFSLNESEELAVADNLEKIALGFMPFKIHLKDFNAINNQEIFINLQELRSITHLINKIKALEFNLQNAKFNALPRISIAQNLQPWQYEKSWRIYQRQRFSATFLATEMLLLKRMEGYISWQILRSMNFENLLIDNPPY